MPLDQDCDHPTNAFYPSPRLRSTVTLLSAGGGARHHWQCIHCILIFDAEVYAIYQALRIFEERQQTGRKYTVLSDYQPAIRRVLTDALGPCQQWARASIEVATRLISRGNEVLSCRYRPTWE